VRSHKPRIGESLRSAWVDFVATGAPVSGVGFAAYLEARGRHGEAAFYMGTLRDLVEISLDGGLDQAQAQRYAELLLRDVLPSDVPVEPVAAALLPPPVSASSD
jgi:hypothetical protein